MSNIGRNVLYTGMTHDLAKRVLEHRNSPVKSFVSKYRCFYLVYYEICESYDGARIREKQIKGWKRSKKDSLVQSLNPGLIDLAPSILDLRFPS